MLCANSFRMKITDNAGDPKFLRDWNLFVWEATAGNWLWDLHRTEQEASRVGGSLVCCCILRGNPADSTRNPQMLLGSRGDGICFLGGTPRGRFRNLARDKNSGASVRILGKLSCEMYSVALKYVVDRWSTVFWRCCKKTTFRRWPTAVRVASEVPGYGIQGSD